MSQAQVADEKLLEETKALMIKRYPRFASQIAKAKLSYRTDLPYHTAATDGENIYFDPQFMASLAEEQRLFIIAHELMHVKFEHMYRIKDKNGEMRDLHIWNIATDAIINANLARDGFTIPEGAVNMPEAINYSAEKMYDKLLKENKDKQKMQGNSGQNSQSGQGQGESGQQSENQQDSQGNSQGQQGQNQQSSSGSSGQNQNGNDQEGRGDFCDDHSLWEEAYNNKNNKKQKEQGNNDKKEDEKDKGKEQGAGKESFKDKLKNKFHISNKNNNDHQQSQQGQESKENNTNNSSENNNNSSSSKAGSYNPNDTQPANDYEDSGNNDIKEYEAEIDEKSEFAKNREQRLSNAKKNLEQKKHSQTSKASKDPSFTDLGTEKAILDWKDVLRSEYEKSETVWSKRRSIRANNYSYRLMDDETDDEAMTEVMIDVSGSVSAEMVKSFLRQLKPIVKTSKIKVGFFATYATSPSEFQLIESEKDIDKIHIIRPGSSTNMDAAVRAFSSDPTVNKIVFTDGCAGVMPGSDTKGINVIWLVYENYAYAPCCGKVIKVHPKDLKIVNAVQEKEREL